MLSPISQDPRPSPQEGQVLDALGARSAPALTLNELAARCDCSVSRISLALMALEAQGRARFRSGRWSSTPGA